MRTAIATVAETRRLEAELIGSWGVPEGLLMERAALSVALLVRQVAAPTAPVTVLAGCGNNGADGLAAARILKGWGYAPTVYLMPGTGTASHAQQLAWAGRWGVTLRPFEPETVWPKGAVIVDALFGFGLNRAPEGLAVRAIQSLLAAEARAILAVDLPSGLDGTTGTALGAVVQATHTVAAGVLKSGLLCDPALAAVGRLYLGDIGLAPGLLDELPGEVIQPLPLPVRRLAMHKGEAGSLLVIGGSASMSGAPAMVARAAARIGAGLIYLAVPEPIRDAVAIQMPEAIVQGLPTDPSGGLSEAGWEALALLMERCKAGVLGPGMATGPEAMRLAERLYRTWDRPLVVDADALQPSLLAMAPAGPRILTPHPGEAGRLLGLPAAEIQTDRVAHARTIAQRGRAITVLKGARTIVAEPSGRYGINVFGTPAMATAGSGDMLAGLLGGLLAQGLDPAMAARQGTAIHGLAGEAAAEFGAHRAILATDLLSGLPEALQLLARTPDAGAPLRAIGDPYRERDRNTARRDK